VRPILWLELIFQEGLCGLDLLLLWEVSVVFVLCTALAIINVPTNVILTLSLFIEWESEREVRDGSGMAVHVQ
jgi:hypothetical protein